MYVVIVEFTIRSEHAAAFKRRVIQQANDSLQLETDCHVFDVCFDRERENYVLLYEVYTDKAAFDAHLAAPHFLDFDATVRPWVSDRKLSTLERQ